jgi:hypothetical protein
MTPPRNPPVYYNNSSYSQPSMMARDGPLANNVSGTNNNNSNAYLNDLHSHSVQSKYAHVRIKFSLEIQKITYNLFRFSREIICWAHPV